MRIGSQPGARPARTELVSIAERMAHLRAMRLGFAAVVLGVGVFAPELRAVSLAAVAGATGLYLLLLITPEVTARLSRARLLPVIGATLLIDGVYLAWATYATGGSQSPLRLLIYVHIVAVTLLSSYRTGLKITAWHALLMFVAFYAQSAGYLEVRETLLTALPGRGDDFGLVATLNIGGLWVVALATAMFSATSERELRAQKIDLEQLSGMVAEFDQRTAASDIPRILLDRLCEVFGFKRGAVLASPPREEDLALLSYRGLLPPPGEPPGLDPVTERAWDLRQAQLVRRLDPETHPHLARLFPGGRNLLIVPLFLDRGLRLGIVVLEHAGTGDTIKSWIVTMIQQFATHAALAMHNAWLLDENAERLEENRGLQSELLAQNLALEARVQERTAELQESLENLRMVDGQRRKLLTRLVNAEEEERRRIAADIHDGPIQQLVAAGLQLDILRTTLVSGRMTAAAMETIEEVLTTLSGSVSGMRSLIFELRPSLLDHDGLGAALLQCAEQLEPELKFKFRNELKVEPPPETGIIVYRIAQEALANVRKHAQARSVEITLAERDGGFLVRIQDDGVGFSPPELLQSSPGHLGLSSMRERAEMAGGRCEVRSLPGAGTTVEFWVPGAPQEHRPPDVFDGDGGRAAARGNGKPVVMATPERLASPS